MAFLKFNKQELVNLDYSLRREILGANHLGAYINTSIVACNTRRYHGLLVVPVEKLGGEKFVLLSALDESIVLNGKQFNLGIHCYGEEYEPKGHKYIVDFDADSLPTITYKVGPVVLSKTFVLDKERNQLLVSYKLVSAPGKVNLIIKPFLAFRNVHSLTQENPVASTDFTPVANGASYRMYDGFPNLVLQTNVKNEYKHQPYWYKGITYSDEYRRGFDCREDLLVPGTFTVEMKPETELVLSASLEVEATTGFKTKFKTFSKAAEVITSYRGFLMENVDRMKVVVNGQKQICAGYSWLHNGLLRETLETLPGLTLYAGGNTKEFEEILDCLIKNETTRLYHRTTQIEAPLKLTDAIQQYIAYTGKEKEIWKKYGTVLKDIVESYSHREYVYLHDNGLLWAQKQGTALTWMNTYVNGWPVNERPGYQVETNALWYNALCFAIEMEGKYAKKSEFVAKWTPVRDAVKANYQPTFLIKSRRGYHFLADYVDSYGQHRECRPNMLWAAYIPYPLFDEQVQADIVASVEKELVTRRGIRTLSPRSEDFKGVYEGTQDRRDVASFNGCCRTSLLGIYEDICFRMIGKNFCGKAKWLTEGIYEDINKHGVGAFSEIYDGDAPHEAHGAISSATAVAALCRCQYLLDQYSKEEVQ